MKVDKQIEEMGTIIATKAFERAYEIDGDENLADIVATELYDKGYRKASEVAREIFEEIEEIRLRQIRKSEFFRNGSTEEMERKFYEGAEWGLRQLSHWFAELKKKYESEDTE